MSHTPAPRAAHPVYRTHYMCSLAVLDSHVCGVADAIQIGSVSLVDCGSIHDLIASATGVNRRVTL
jgi:hypothetical protein